MARPLQSLRLRQVAVQTLRADADLIGRGNPAIADRIYGRRQPPELEWPFIRVSVADEGPLRLGTSIRVTVHSFSKATFDDECEQLNIAIQAVLENAVLQLSPSVKAFVEWISSQVMPDAAEASAWHGLNSFQATIG